MKECNECKIEMIEGSLYGKPRFIDMDHDIDKFYVDIKTGEKTSFLGLKIDKTKRLNLSVLICPKCGRVEMYVNPLDINNKED